MATVRRRGERWQAQVRRQGFPETSKTFSTKTAADRWARKIEQEMDAGIYVDRSEAESTTLHDALSRYLRDVTTRKKSAKREGDRIRAWQARPLARRTLAALRGADFAKYRDDLRAQGLAENTIRLDLALIAHLFEVARKEWGLTGLGNPVRDIRMPAGSRERDRRLSPGEWDRLVVALDQCRNFFVRPVVEIALATAMRQSEILGLDWSRIDLERRTAHIPDTKNGTARTVPLSLGALGVLRALPRSLDGRVFRITQDSLTHAFSDAVARARRRYEEECKENRVPADPRLLIDLRFHDLRHEATSRLFERGLNIMEVASISGHKTLGMLRRYTHLKAEDLARKLE